MKEQQLPSTCTLQKADEYLRFLHFPRFLLPPLMFLPDFPTGVGWVLYFLYCGDELANYSARLRVSMGVLVPNLSLWSVDSY